MKINKKKKKKKLIISLAAVLTLAAAGGTGAYLYYQNNNKDDSEIVLQAGQTLITGQVSSIAGNEITLALAEEYSEDDSNSNRLPGGDKSGPGPAMEGSGPGADVSGAAVGEVSGGSAGMKGGGNRQPPPSGMPQGGGQGNGGSGDKQAMPSGMPQNGSGNGGRANNQPKDSSNPDSQTKDEPSGEEKGSEAQVMYQLTGEEATYTIPVGTRVITQLGKETTFSRIQTEDMLKVVLEKNEEGEEVIAGIWIVG